MQILIGFSISLIGWYDKVHVSDISSQGGDLFDAIKNSVRFTEPVASKMSADMTNALFYLHSRGIVHRDVKPENLMVRS